MGTDAQEYRDLGECQNPDASLDLDGKLLNENFGQHINEDINIEELQNRLAK